jgi:hypothetical protein
MFNGKVTVTIDGKAYTLVMDINAMADFEGLTGKDVFKVLDQIDQRSVRVTELRALFWSFFQTHHPEVTLRQAGVMMASVPDALDKVLKASLPAPEASTEASPEGNPKAAVEA